LPGENNNNDTIFHQIPLLQYGHVSSCQFKLKEKFTSHILYNFKKGGTASRPDLLIISHYGSSNDNCFETINYYFCS
jgi:hypothetical protein